MCSETPARILYEAAGRPVHGRPVVAYAGPCMLCGYPCDGRGVSKDAAIADTFTDQWRAACIEAPAVCEPCAWSIAGQPPKTLRLWSWLWREDRPDLATTAEKCPFRWPGVLATNKADMRPIVQTLLDPPAGRWFVTLADSGQLHVVCWARVNHGSERWCVQMDREAIAAAPRDLATVLYHVCELRLAGFTWTDVLEGQPNGGRLVSIGVDIWRTHDRALRRYRGGPLMRLARLVTKEDHLGEHRDRAAETIGCASTDRVGDGALGDPARARGPDEHPARDDLTHEVVAAPRECAGGLRLERAELPGTGDALRNQARCGELHGDLEQLDLFACG